VATVSRYLEEIGKTIRDIKERGEKENKTCLGRFQDCGRGKN
jgi:hypothetical protein